MAKFIVLYGINNIGKTTQCQNILKYLKDKKLKARYFNTPNYSLKSGREINKILRSKKQTISEAEFQKLSKEIEKQFKKQKVTPEDVDEAGKWARRKSS